MRAGAEAAALRTHQFDAVDSIPDRRMGTEIMTDRLWLQRCKLHHADCGVSATRAGRFERVHVA